MPPPLSTRPRVAVASTGRNPELLQTVPISTRNRKPKVVVFLPQLQAPHASLPDLRPGDRPLVSAELEVTTDCAKQQSDCVKEPYRYQPMVEASLVLANGAAVRTSGSGAVTSHSVV
jgi:hypothetical protein